MASDAPAGMVRSKPSNTASSGVAGYANRTLRKRISRAGNPAAGRLPGASAPLRAIGSDRRSTAAAGAAAPSNAQLRPPKAMALTPNAAVANVTIRSSANAPLNTSTAKQANTTALPIVTTARLASTGRSRRRVACQRKSCNRRRWRANRSTVQAASPNKRTSLEDGASTAKR